MLGGLCENVFTQTSRLRYTLRCFADFPQKAVLLNKLFYYHALRQDNRMARLKLFTQVTNEP